jgi:hypothetical protein
MSGLASEVRGRCVVAALSVWATLTVRDAPELTCTCMLHERKRELLVVVKVIQSLDERGALQTNIGIQIDMARQIYMALQI